MAEYKFSAALNAATFPLVTRFQPRSIIIAGMDNRLRNPASGNTNQDNNPAELPQVLFCENVMPSETGVFSVGFDPIQAQVPTATQFDEVFILRDEDENIAYFSPAQGLNYVTPAFGTPWVSTDPLVGAPVGNEVSVAYVNGITYICYANLWIGHWDGTNFVDDTANLQGVNIADITCITGSGTYLIAGCTDLSFKWSSVTDPLDFTPDETTGAGSQIPVDVKGKLVALTTVSGGVIIHCEQNAVAALSTNNSAAPWTFREIRNAGGIKSRKQVSIDNASGATYIFGTNGFQQLTLRESANMFPAVTDFLAGKVIETFNGATNTLSIQRLTANLSCKIANVAGRYIVISYGTVPYSFTHALIYDNELKRWGKIKQSHVDAFSSFTDPRQSICLLSETGVVYEVVLDGRLQTDAGVLILGRYQLNRTSAICNQYLEIEVLDSTDSLGVIAVANYNGTTVGDQLPLLQYENTDNFREFQGQIEATNISYVLKGTFHISSIVITATKGVAL